MAVDEKPVLESWKEISSYLNRSQKTCQRWEHEAGLPIHRLDGTPKAHVFAYPEELDLWLAKKPHHREAPVRGPKPARRSKLGPALVAAGVLVAAATVILWGPILGPPPPVPAAKPWLAILNFDNPGGDESLEAWKTALPMLLTLDLEQSRYIRVGGPSTPAELEKVAARRNIDYVLSGSLLMTSGNLLFTTTV